MSGADVPHLLGRRNGLPTWAAASAVLAATGPDGRRAAARALAAAATGSVVNTAVVKPLVGRRRPAGAHRSTASFASGHTTTAAAFATAAWQVWPPAGPPCALAAGLIAVGRVRDGEHHVTDVVAGAALGIVTALVVGVGARRLVSARGCD